MKPKGGPEPRYIDRPEISEIFADRLTHLFFDGATVRMEFTVTRPEPAPVVAGKPAGEQKQWAYTACRVVLATSGVVDMLNKMQELQAMLANQGVIELRPNQAPQTSQASAAPQA